jgi:hypothetical protein
LESRSCFIGASFAAGSVLPSASSNGTLRSQRFFHLGTPNLHCEFSASDLFDCYTSLPYD